MRISGGTGERYKAEKRFVKKDGSFFWGEISVSAIKDSEGSVQNVIMMIADITKRKNTEDTLRIAAIAFESHEGMTITDSK
jgi:PAS domain S-box-containing protein